jgi:GNAT superfamily N-acetyltransferase
VEDRDERGPTREFRVVDKDTEGASAFLGRFHREILAASFSANEYVPPEDPEEADGPWLVVCTADGTVVGGALGEWYPDSETLLLGYIATRDGWRGKHVGTLVVEAIKERWFTPETFALGEIEDPRHHVTDKAFGDPVARLRFYSRFNVDLLGMPYFQPSLAESQPRAYHLLLAVYAAPANVRVGDGVTAGRVGRFLREYFQACEGPDALDDPQVQWLLGWCDRDRIPMVPPAELARVPDDEPPDPGSV